MIFVSGPCLHPIRLRQAANRGQSQAKIPSACPPNSPSRRNRARASGTGIAHGQRAAHRAHAGHRQLLRVLRLARRAHGGTGDHTPATPPHSARAPGTRSPSAVAPSRAHGAARHRRAPARATCPAHRATARPCHCRCNPLAPTKMPDASFSSSSPRSRPMIAPATSCGTCTGKASSPSVPTLNVAWTLSPGVPMFTGSKPRGTTTLCASGHTPRTAAGTDWGIGKKCLLALWCKVCRASSGLPPCSSAPSSPASVALLAL